MSSYFPYEFREGQKEMMEFVDKNLGRNMCVGAPTGFGKTPLLLASLLPETSKNGFKIIWCVRTGNETDRPIEELKIINKALPKHRGVFGISYRGKKDMCLLAKDMKLKLSHEDASLLCKRKEKECKYRENLADADISELLAKPVLYSEIIDFCERRKVCPYFVQRELAVYADVIGLSYNYIISESVSWGVKGIIPFSSSFLVVDEAHNLQNACMNVNSDRITLKTLDYGLEELENLCEEDKEIFDLMRAMRTLVFEEFTGMEKSGEGEKEFGMKNYLKAVKGKLGIGDLEMTTLLENIRKLGIKTRRKQIDSGKSPHSYLYHLSNFFLSSMRSLETEGIVFIASRFKGNPFLELWDMRTSEVLKERWNMFRSCVFCSGTLKPIDGFAETVGLEKYVGNEFPSLFDKKNIKTFITKGLTTKGEILKREMTGKYLNSVDRFLGYLNTNTAIFTASYRIQKDLLDHGLEKIIKKNNRRFFLENEGMDGKSARKILDEFKSCAYGDKKGVLCASMQGRFAEGADFPGKELEGIFLVGIPFDRLTVKTNLYIDYCKKLYGSERGVYYAYIIPALRKASQALGRALRSREDKATFILGDERYSQPRFFSLLPDYIKRTAKIINSGDLFYAK